MPWNDASKPADKPGPWDLPGGDDRGSEPSARPQAKPGAAPPTRPSRNASPWDRAAPEEPPRLRRPTRVGPPKVAAPPPARGPDLNELRRQLFAGLTGARGKPVWRAVRVAAAGGLVVGLLTGWAASGVYRIEEGRIGVVTRFGRVEAEVGPGLHYHWPWPVGAVRNLPVGASDALDLGGEEAQGASRWRLTRDGALVDVAATVQWRVADPARYLTRAAEPEVLIGVSGRSALRQALGAADLSDILSAGHGGVAMRMVNLMQADLDRAGSGVQITGVQLRDVRPPPEAEAGLRDVSVAAEAAQTAVQGVASYRTKVLAEAKADAAKLVQTAQGYRDQEISEAKGEAARFTRIDEQYRKAPEVTRERLYTETMERVLHNANKVIVQAPKAGSTQIVLPAEVLRNRRPDPSSAAPVQAAPASGGASSAASSVGDAGASGGPTA